MQKQQQQPKKPGIRGRKSPRLDMQGQVAIRLQEATVIGSGENISLQGVFFTSDGALPVTVQVAGHGEVTGTLVRVESMGDGRIGIAVRFDAPQPTLLPPA